MQPITVCVTSITNHSVALIVNQSICNIYNQQWQAQLYNKPTRQSESRLNIAYKKYVSKSGVISPYKQEKTANQLLRKTLYAMNIFIFRDG